MMDNKVITPIKLTMADDYGSTDLLPVLHRRSFSVDNFVCKFFFSCVNPDFVLNVDNYLHGGGEKKSMKSSAWGFFEGSIASNPYCATGNTWVWMTGLC
ncbi:hypothetical protein KIK84_02815 [Curvibacter sp. CHRR-16]|uniref:hypothetical protein n=1 Tax=Curvibacter sp. CHRR-16 TaxID=2835872 RepID=UPI001BDA1C32|nr:hypothetical protein [Curvibacter sp. CHRR-16]MBT0569247.1 hypothetical protein [Curvibacter sp. CHRR-16]